MTARDRQVRTAANGTVWYELGRGKAFDTSAPLGPVVVTADEIADPQALHISMRINGELRQNSSTSDMIWSCADLIHFFSTNFTLKPGMVIITGSPAGTAWSTDTRIRRHLDAGPRSRSGLPLLPAGRSDRVRGREDWNTQELCPVTVTITRCILTLSSAATHIGRHWIFFDLQVRTSYTRDLRTN